MFDPIQKEPLTSPLHLLLPKKHYSPAPSKLKLSPATRRSERYISSLLDTVQVVKKLLNPEPRHLDPPRRLEKCASEWHITPVSSLLTAETKRILCCPSEAGHCIVLTGRFWRVKKRTNVNRWETLSTFVPSTMTLRRSQHVFWRHRCAEIGELSFMETRPETWEVTLSK